MSADNTVDQFVLGVWVCPRCDFTLVQNTLNPATGAIRVDDSSVFEICPNDMTKMEKQTWQMRCESLARVCETQIARASNAEHLLRQIFYARCALGTKFCDELDRWALEDLYEAVVRAIGLQ